MFLFSHLAIEQMLKWGLGSFINCLLSNSTCDQKLDDHPVLRCSVNSSYTLSEVRKCRRGRLGRRPCSGATSVLGRRNQQPWDSCRSPNSIYFITACLPLIPQFGQSRQEAVVLFSLTLHPVPPVRNGKQRLSASSQRHLPSHSPRLLRAPGPPTHQNGQRPGMPS